MGLTLGKDLNRSYKLRLPFLDKSIDIEIFFNSFSNIVLFKVDENRNFSNKDVYGVKINFFKNIRLSPFAGNILNLHNYRNTHIDISNQYVEIKDEFKDEIRNNLNENIYLAKYTIDNNKDIYESLTFYGFILTSFTDEYIYLISERQHIIKKLEKKIVRSTALQIGTTQSIDFLNQLISKD